MKPQTFWEIFLALALSHPAHAAPKEARADHHLTPSSEELPIRQALPGKPYFFQAETEGGDELQVSLAFGVLRDPYAIWRDGAQLPVSQDMSGWARAKIRGADKRGRLVGSQEDRLSTYEINPAVTSWAGAGARVKSSHLRKLRQLSGEGFGSDRDARHFSAEYGGRKYLYKKANLGDREEIEWMENEIWMQGLLRGKKHEGKAITPPFRFLVVDPADGEVLGFLADFLEGAAPADVDDRTQVEACFALVRAVYSQLKVIQNDAFSGNCLFVGGIPSLVDFEKSKIPESQHELNAAMAEWWNLRI